MPLVGFRPTKARLVMENAKDSVLVMKVVLAADDAVELTTGGALQDLQGVLRIRERKANGAGNGNGVIGAIVYVADGERDAAAPPGKYQVNVAMPADRFAQLLRVATTGRLPTKFFVDAGETPARRGTAALGYRNRAGTRVKVWDNHAHRSLPVTNFVMILPIDIAPAPETPMPSIDAAVPAPPVALATNAQVAELMDDMLVFQSDTRNTMFGLVCVLALVALAALALSLAIFFR